MVRQTIDLEQIKNHLFLIRPSYCPQLKELKVKLDEIEEKIENLAEKVFAYFSNKVFVLSINNLIYTIL